MAAPANGSTRLGIERVALRLPIRPAIELTKINMAEMAEAVFVRAQCMKITSGVKKIPPPVPVRPESKPSPAPTPNATGFVGGFGSPSAGGRNKNLAAENSSTSPTSTLKMWPGKFHQPPRNAIG